jgi:hypothetical protein
MHDGGLEIAVFMRFLGSGSSRCRMVARLLPGSRSDEQRFVVTPEDPLSCEPECRRANHRGHVASSIAPVRLRLDELDTRPPSGFELLERSLRDDRLCENERVLVSQSGSLGDRPGARTALAGRYRPVPGCDQAAARSTTSHSMPCAVKARAVARPAMPPPTIRTRSVFAISRPSPVIPSLQSAPVDCSSVM